MARCCLMTTFILASAAVFARAADPTPIQLAKGDKIVFFGDSITAGGGGPDGYLTVIKKVLDEKHKDLGIEIINAGISGHKVPNLQHRLGRDVLSRKPNIVVIYIGINDVGQRARHVGAGLRGRAEGSHHADQGHWGQGAPLHAFRHR